MSALAFVDWHWRQVTRCDHVARVLADGHYSRQTVGAREFMASGKTLVLVTFCGLATWGAIENLDPAGNLRWRCSIFHREKGAPLASELVREATTHTYKFWRAHYGELPPVPLQTEVDPRKVRRKRDPGRCFLRAGWTQVDERRGLVILQAPSPPRDRRNCTTPPCDGYCTEQCPDGREAAIAYELATRPALANPTDPTP